jgi:hypothetical protein
LSKENHVQIHDILVALLRNYVFELNMYNIFILSSIEFRKTHEVPVIASLTLTALFFIRVALEAAAEEESIASLTLTALFFIRVTLEAAAEEESIASLTLTALFFIRVALKAAAEEEGMASLTLTTLFFIRVALKAAAEEEGIAFHFVVVLALKAAAEEEGIASSRRLDKSTHGGYGKRGNQSPTNDGTLTELLLIGLSVSKTFDGHDWCLARGM